MGRYPQHRIALKLPDPVDTLDTFFQQQVRRFNDRLVASVRKITTARAQTRSEAFADLEIRKTVGTFIGYGNRSRSREDE